MIFPAQRSDCSRIQGFTLIELSMVIAILSMVLTGGLVVGTNVVQQQSLKGTRDEIETLQQALINYQAVNGRLPCVAPITAALSTASFGREITPGSTTCDASTAVPAGTWRVAQGGGQVRIGGIPTRTLGLPDRAAADKFGNRYLYAVTETHTSTTGFSASGNVGMIRIRDLGNFDISNNASFVVVSHGKNAQGAYKYFNGVLASACSSGLELENCNNDGVFVDERYNDANTANYFDDLVGFTPKYVMTAGGGGSGATSLWAASSADIFSVGTDGDFRTGSVGIGTQTPVAGFEVVYDNRTLGATGIENDFVFSRFENSNDLGPLSLRRARGTPTAPLNLQNGDGLGGYVDLGFVNGAFAPLNSIQPRYHGNGTNLLSSMAFLTSGLVGAGPATVIQERMRIDSEGDVGIGTANPTQKLHVVSTTAGDATNVQIGSGPNSMFLTANDAYVSGNLRYDDNTWRHESAGAGSAIGLNNGVVHFLTTPSRAAGADAGTLTEHMRLTNNGFLGIGTLNPTRMLDVNGWGRVTTEMRVRPHDTIANEGGQLLLDNPTSYVPGSVIFDVYEFGGINFLRTIPVENEIPYPLRGIHMDLTNGFLGIGQPNPKQKLHVNGSVQINMQLGGWSHALWFDNPSANTDSVYFQRWNVDTDRTMFFLVIGDNVDTPAGPGLAGDSFLVSTTGGGTLMQINSDGGGWLRGAWTAPSDRRLKTDIRALEKYGLETVMALKPSIYKMKRDAKNEDKLGFIAQDIEKLVPELVSVHEEFETPPLQKSSEDKTEPLKEPEKKVSEKTLALEYDGLIPVLTRAIQDLKHEHDALKAEVEALKTGGHDIAGAPSDNPMASLRFLYALIALLGGGVIVLSVRVSQLAMQVNRPN
jgi:prepilin-type N-terminal cleavage/methylation domain-containing protein